MQENKKNHITHTSIYSWLNTGGWDKFREFLLHKYKGYRKKKTVKWSKIKDRVSIEKRPEKANNRTEKWHFEADLIVSKKWFKWALLTLVDRKTRLPQIFKIKDKSSQKIMDLILSVQKDIGIHSITFDNWMEFAFHKLLNEAGIDTYFSDPYSPRQKWSIENLNWIIRRTFPKWTIFDNISEEKIKSVCFKLANTPREILGFKSPNQEHFPIIQ
jgi:IS30 family transposase